MEAWKARALILRPRGRKACTAGEAFGTLGQTHVGWLGERRLLFASIGDALIRMRRGVTDFGVGSLRSLCRA